MAKVAARDALEPASETADAPNGRSPVGLQAARLEAEPPAELWLRKFSYVMPSAEGLVAVLAKSSTATSLLNMSAAMFQQTVGGHYGARMCSLRPFFRKRAAGGW